MARRTNDSAVALIREAHEALPASVCGACISGILNTHRTDLVESPSPSDAIGSGANFLAPAIRVLVVVMATSKQLASHPETCIG